MGDRQEKSHRFAKRPRGLTRYQTCQHVHMAHTPIQVEVSEKLEKAITAMLAIAPLSASATLSVLRRVGESIAVSPDDIDAAFERVKLRSASVELEVRRLDGGGLSDSEFADKLGIASRRRIRAYREKGKLFAWKKGARTLRYPAWQIHEGALLPGLAEVLSILDRRKMSPLAIADYFLSESDELDGNRPLDLLRKNHVEPVLAHAARHGAHGA
ncbi:hypothetical protein [Opitutus terrae]|nr:hypothetical protein [Opitutus terrae]